MSSWSTSGPPPFTFLPPLDDDVASAYDKVVAERDAAVSRLHHYTERYDRERDDLLKKLAEAEASLKELAPAKDGMSTWGTSSPGKLPRRSNGALVPSPVEDEVDMVNSPPHYNSDPSGIETIRFIEHKTFNIGNAIKYLDRSPYKVNQIEDLNKAIWYVQREIGRLDKLAGEVS